MLSSKAFSSYSFSAAVSNQLEAGDFSCAPSSQVQPQLDGLARGRDCDIGAEDDSRGSAGDCSCAGSRSSDRVAGDFSCAGYMEGRNYGFVDVVLHLNNES